MTQAILHPEELERWRGLIRDGQVAEEDEPTEQDEQEQPADEETGRSRKYHHEQDE